MNYNIDDLVNCSKFSIDNSDNYITLTPKSEFSNVRNSPLRESNFGASESPKQNKKELFDKTISKKNDSTKQ
jgi:hypothetical protein